MDYKSDYYWLNEDSRKFLEKGYVPAGMTPEQRFRQIADNAERILGIEGFADKFEGYFKFRQSQGSSSVLFWQLY